MDQLPYIHLRDKPIDLTASINTGKMIKLNDLLNGKEPRILAGVELKTFLDQCPPLA